MLVICVVCSLVSPCSSSLFFLWRRLDTARSRLNLIVCDPWRAFEVSMCSVACVWEFGCVVSNDDSTWMSLCRRGRWLEI